MNDSTEIIQKKPSKAILVGIIGVLSLLILSWLFLGQEDKIVEIAPVVVEPIAPVIEEDPVELEEVIVEPIVEVIEEIVEVITPLPTLDESDGWLQEKLPSLTWRKELLKLVINEDMIRRFVVFTDNFSQGLIAYEHSPLIAPATTFSAIEKNSANNESKTTWQWDDTSTRRFSLYVDLLRSVDTDSLVEWYIELKPLIDQAYSELGYPDDDFTDILQSTITRVLDMELPKEPIELVRPSVMYRYKNAETEALDDADKLLLRLGKDNLLVIKSILLEINEKLARQRQ
ncbi:MAG: DUF3014 domain-containing protein [Colwellia sp.]|nr:DUF3014 domain-containing protein [Colwellia sp.]